MTPASELYVKVHYTLPRGRKVILGAKHPEDVIGSVVRGLLFCGENPRAIQTAVKKALAELDREMAPQCGD